MAELASATLNNSQLAYLSACNTALVGGQLQDESTHLAAAFQIAGFPHVIGTLWEISDEISVEVADRFYKNLTQEDSIDTGRSSYALHEALREIRNDRPGTPSIWAPFVHFGS